LQKFSKPPDFSVSTKFLCDYDASNAADDNFFCAEWKSFLRRLRIMPGAAKQPERFLVPAFVVKLTRTMTGQVSSVLCASTKNDCPVAAGSKQPQNHPWF
jgi:hypothetical protein